MSINLEPLRRAAPSILKVITSDLIDARLKEAQEVLKEAIRAQQTPPPKLAGWKSEIEDIQQKIDRNVHEERRLQTEPHGGLSENAIVQMIESLRDVRASLSKDLASATIRAEALERMWKASHAHIDLAHNRHVAERRVNDLLEAQRLLLRPDPDNYERACYLARTPIERALNKTRLKERHAMEMSENDADMPAASI